MKTSLTLVLLSLYAVSAQAAVVTESFESGGEFWRSTSQGDLYHVSQFGEWIVDGATALKNNGDTSSGFYNNTVSGDRVLTNILHTNTDDLVGITFKNTNIFDAYYLESIWLSTPFKDGTRALITMGGAYQGEVFENSAWVSLSSEPTKINFSNFDNAKLVNGKAVASYFSIYLETKGGINSKYIDFFATAPNSLSIDDFTYDTVAAVPEPSVYAMLGLGLGLLAVATRRRKSA